MTPEYRVGSIVEYVAFGGIRRTVTVTRKERYIKNGKAGFDGITVPEGESVWGYDDQITRVVRLQSEPEINATVKKLLGALEAIAHLWPYPPNCADVMSVSGVNDGRARAILLDAALKISREALADYKGETYVHPEEAK